jgi:L-ascorbate metabolism protein UlaG (beta-lactamase superfamily)
MKNRHTKLGLWVIAPLLLAIALIPARSIREAAAQQGDAAPPHNPTVSDVIETTAGDLRITPVGHASIMFEIGERAIHVDPVGDYSEMRNRRADLILITDIHGDHMNAESARSIAKVGAVVIGPPDVYRSLGIPTAIAYANGETSLVNLPDMGVPIETVPAYNLTRGPSEGELYHPQGRGQGYIITLGERRIFVSGDTECVPEIQALENIDVAFLPMNLPFTMTPEEAADCAKAFRPSIVYPYHYRGQDPQVFADALAAESDIEVRLREWY